MLDDGMARVVPVMRMPRVRVEYPHEVELVQVVDEEGNIDGKLEPNVPAEDLRRLYRMMLFVREYDDTRMKLQRRGEIGTFAPVKGQEAAQLGSVYPLRESDWTVPSFRETAVAFWRGMAPENDLLYVAGFEEGMALPEGSRDLPISVPVGSQTCHAVGVAWAAKLQGKDEVAMCYFGDGATSEGDFHEAMNFAGVYRAPVVFFNQNNGWAISVPREKQTASKTLAQKAWAYGFPGVQVDGNDILAVIRVTQEAVERARGGDGATMIEALTYRMGVHTTADDPTKYRSEDEVTKWAKKDPIERFHGYLVERGHVDDHEVEAWREEIKTEVKEVVERYRAKRPSGLVEMFDHHMSGLDPYTARQRDALVEYWKKAGTEVAH